MKIFKLSYYMYFNQKSIKKKLNISQICLIGSGNFVLRVYSLYPIHQKFEDFLISTGVI